MPKLLSALKIAKLTAKPITFTSSTGTVLGNTLTSINQTIKYA
jgi:hypothetical protein